MRNIQKVNDDEIISCRDMLHPPKSVSTFKAIEKRARKITGSRPTGKTPYDFGTKFHLESTVFPCHHGDVFHNPPEKVHPFQLPLEMEFRDQSPREIDR